MKKALRSVGLRFSVISVLFVCGSISAAGSGARVQPNATLSGKDAAAVRATIEAYRAAWLAGDEEAVLKTLTDEAVLLPPHASPPVVGRSAIKKYWWPDDAPPTKVTKLNITIEEIGGSGAVAYARGRDEVAWSFEQRGTTETHAHAGYYLNIMRKLPDGTWRISHHMWDDPVLPPTVSAQPPMAATTPPQGPLKPYVMEMIATLKPDTGAVPPPRRFSDKLEETTWHGRQAMRRESASSGAGGTAFVRWEINIFDAMTLLPHSSEWRRADGLFLHREFDGLRVTETRTSADVLKSPPLPPEAHVETLTMVFELPEPAYDWIGGAGLPILLALPLREGLEGSVPVISGDSTIMSPCTVGPCFVVRMTYRVSGPELVKGISGTPVRTWKIWVPETRFRFWISCDNPRLEQVTWPGPGGGYSMGGISKP